MLHTIWNVQNHMNHVWIHNKILKRKSEEKTHFLTHSVLKELLNLTSTGYMYCLFDRTRFAIKLQHWYYNRAIVFLSDCKKIKTNVLKQVASLFSLKVMQKVPVWALYHYQTAFSRHMCEKTLYVYTCKYKGLPSIGTGDMINFPNQECHGQGHTGQNFSMHGKVLP